MGALEILPAAAGEAAEVFEVIFVCSLEGRTLVATPQAAWHRRAAQRRLPPGALVGATAVEVAPASRTSRAELAPDARIKVWLGFLEPGLSEATRFDMLVHSRGRRRWIPTSWRGFGRGGEGQVPVRDCGERRAITARSRRTHRGGSAGPSGGCDGDHGGDGEDTGGQAYARPTWPWRPGCPDGASKFSCRWPREAKAGAPALPGLDPGVVQSALAAGVSQDALRGDVKPALLEPGPALEGGSAARRRPGCFRRERCGANLRPRPGGRRIWISGPPRRRAIPWPRH